MKTIITLIWAIFAVFAFLIYVSAKADVPKIDPVLGEIQADATANKGRKDYIKGFCDGLRAAAWAEAQQHGWSVSEDGLMPPTVAFPDKTTFTCRKVKP